MQTNELPTYDMSDNPTGCCPRFNPEGWDYQTLHFENKPFVKATTMALFHIPLNLGSIFTKTFKAIEAAHAMDESNFIVLSYDPSPWSGEHYFSVTKEVPGQEMAYLSGDYLTKVFEGPYKEAPNWVERVKILVKELNREVDKTYFFYTTCPKCAKVYGKNYVVAVAELKP